MGCSATREEKKALGNHVMKLGEFPNVVVDILRQIACMCGHKLLKLYAHKIRLSC